VVRSSRPLVALVVLLGVAVVAPFATSAQSAPPRAERTLDDYKHFRVLAIDLAGRMPTRDEIAAFERPDFDTDKWIDAQLKTSGYVERLTRVFMDVLRLEPNLNFSSSPAQLYRADVLGPDGKVVNVFYRGGQRRAREATDGEFCLSPDETGQVIRPNAGPIGTQTKVSEALLDQYTVLVRPWWLYRDYHEAEPKLRYGDGWKDVDPEYRPVEALLNGPDGKPTLEVRICREEAQKGETGHIYASGRTNAPPPKAKDAKNGAQPPKPPPPPAPKPVVAPVAPGMAPTLDAKAAMPVPKFVGGRLRPAPKDSAYATQHKGDPVACETKLALDMSLDCGCGVGLERCTPNSGDGQNPAFYYPNHMPLGPGLPLDDARQSALRWYPYWWSREVVRYFDHLFADDRDFREVLTGRETFVNGPLAQFYKTIQRGNCCGPEASFGMTEETEPLFDPKMVPTDLAPTDVGTWKLVADRGPHASGILTMPIFLEKYASARARGAVLYNAFLCKSFLADKSQLTPSTEPNLMVRPGCQTCHATLEPLAAYFARVEPGNFVFLPEDQFPSTNAKCKKDKNGHLPGQCNALYDVAFADDKGAMLRSAYGSQKHADETPVGAGADIVKMPEFAQCAVQHVASSFFGRATTPDDEPLLESLTTDFVKSGYRMRELVKEIVRSDTYRRANNTGPSMPAPNRGAP
jgi:Protein of unknown function (DUF1585)/Protein of unknown function (DUF1553)